MNATTPSQVEEPIALADVNGVAQSDVRRRVFDAAVGENVDAAVVLRDEFETGTLLKGPAIVTEDETTIIVPQSREAMRQSDGCIDITVQG